VGVVSQRDLFRSVLASVFGYGEKARANLLKTIRVKEVMSEPAVTTPPDTLLPEAARVMVDRKIGCLPVVESGELVGVVTETDLLRQIADS
jgi:CBS domain-containing protein